MYVCMCHLFPPGAWELHGDEDARGVCAGLDFIVYILLFYYDLLNDYTSYIYIYIYIHIMLPYSILHYISTTLYYIYIYICL